MTDVKLLLSSNNPQIPPHKWQFKLEVFVILYIFLYKNNKTLPKWSYHYNLPKFTCTTQVIV